MKKRLPILGLLLFILFSSSSNLVYAQLFKIPEGLYKGTLQSKNIFEKNYDGDIIVVVANLAITGLVTFKQDDGTVFFITRISQNKLRKQSNSFTFRKKKGILRFKVKKTSKKGEPALIIGNAIQETNGNFLTQFNSTYINDNAGLCNDEANVSEDGFVFLRLNALHNGKPFEFSAVGKLNENNDFEKIFIDQENVIPIHIDSITFSRELAQNKMQVTISTNTDTTTVNLVGGSCF